MDKIRRLMNRLYLIMEPDHIKVIMMFSFNCIEISYLNHIYIKKSFLHLQRFINDGMAFRATYGPIPARFNTRSNYCLRNTCLNYIKMSIQISHIWANLLVLKSTRGWKSLYKP